MAIDNYVSIDISLETKPLSVQGFGTPLILTTEANGEYGGDLVRAYTGPESLVADWATSAQAYKAAIAAFSQNPAPAIVKIAVAPTPVAGIATVTFAADLITGNTGTVTVNGTPVPYTYDTSQQMTATTLAAAIDALPNVTASVGGTPYRVITVAGTAGEPLTITASAVTGGASQTTATVGWSTPPLTLADTLTALVEEDNDWYGLALATNKDNTNILTLAAWIEARLKVFVSASDDSAVLSNGAGNVLAALKAKGYNRTFYRWEDEPTEHGEVAWLAQGLTEAPGSATWMFKTQAGITPDVLTPTERLNVLASNGNIYTEQGGIAIAEPGKMVGGEYIDVIIGRDWLEARMAERIFALLVKTKKVPYTDHGGALLESEVRGQLAEAGDAGVLDAEFGYTVTVPKAASQSSANRANRVFPGITFSARLAGAIHKAEIRGTVSV